MRNSTQLPAAEASKGFQILLDVIKEFRSGHNALFLGGKYRVSAEVQGKPMVDDETISCILTPHHDSVDVSVYWEDMGLRRPAYNKLGLYGKMNSRYQAVRRRGDRLIIKGHDFKLTIKLVKNAPGVDPRPV